MERRGEPADDGDDVDSPPHAAAAATFQIGADAAPVEE